MTLNTIYADRELTAEHFNGHEADQYTGTIEEARQELAYWVEQGWATTEPTAENTVEITAKDMQAAICKHLLAPITITTFDPNERGVITSRAGVEIDAVSFASSEDAVEWERMADAELEANGWRRVSEWGFDGGAHIATLDRA